MANCIKCAAALPEGALFCPMCGKEQHPKKRSGRTRGNGTGSVYKRGSTWTASVVLGYKHIDGKAQAIRKTKGGFKTKREAIEYIPSLRQERARTAPTLMTLWEQFQEGHYTKLSASRQEKYRIAWPKMAPIHFTRIDLLVLADLQKIINTKAPTYSPARDIRDLISLLYQLAMVDQFVTVNLASFLILPDCEETEREPFTSEEVTQLWEDYGAGNWWTGYILLMIYSGMMPGELRSARKEHIDWAKQQIQGAGKKTKKRKQVPIALADVIVPVLRDLCDHTQGDKIIDINKKRFYAVYYATLARAGCRKLPPYSCRHTTATTLVLENVQPSVIQQVMRHAKYTTTQAYIHVDTDTLREAVNQMGKLKDRQRSEG